jgi:hypothetical protein
MQWAEKVKQLQNLTKPLNQNRMRSNLGLPHLN